MFLIKIYTSRRQALPASILSSFGQIQEKAMDVSWKRKKSINGNKVSEINLVAELVGNHHKAGNGSSNFTTQLGAIGEKYLNSKARDMKAFHQGLFWERVDRKLKHLTLKPQERQKIESIISETVPRPDADWALWSVTCIPRYDP